MYDTEAPRPVVVEPAQWRDFEVPRGKRLDLRFKARVLGGFYGQAGKVALLARGKNFWNVVWLEIRFALRPPSRLSAFVDTVSQLSGLSQVIWCQPRDPAFEAAVQLRGRSREHPEILKVDLQLIEVAGWLRGTMDIVGRFEGTNHGGPTLTTDRFEIAFKGYDLDLSLETVAAHLRHFCRASRDLPIPVAAPAPLTNEKLPVPAEPGQGRVHQLPTPGDIDPA